MSEKLTILVTPMEGVGHVNACIGVAENLRDRGHRIIFVVEKAFEGRLLQYGFEKEVFKESLENEKPGQQMVANLSGSGLMKDTSPLEKLEIIMSGNVWGKLIDKRKDRQSELKAILDKYKPDIILMDESVGVPSIIYSDIPWINIVSTNPLFMIEDERTPPGGSGYPIDGNKSDWKQFRETKDQFFLSAKNHYNEWMKELGLPLVTGIKCIPDSPFLNVYGFPEELDYTDVRPLSDKWFRVDSFTRKGVQEFKIPEKFENRDKKTQKLIYLSLGSMVSVNIELMKRLIDILSKSPHKYIISKGLLGDKYELPDNMWGQNSVPQTRVLPLMDLVITHGGNNTVTETFSFGKPMIVMPMFADQFDNAQRVQETGFGIRMNPFRCTEEELLGAIDKLLSDADLKNRLDLAAKRISEYKSLDKLSEKIEKLAKK